MPRADLQLEPDADAITVWTTHFSDWSRLSGLQLWPPEKTMREGETLVLTAVDCEPQHDAEDQTPTLLSLCSIDAELPPLPGFVQEWAVDGIPGGSEGVGTISPGTRADQAIYTAPEFAVGVERHTVSAKMRRNGRTLLLVSNITVMGEFTFELSGFYSADMSYEACTLVPSSVNDQVDVVLAPGDSGIYNVQDITNHTTTFVLGSLPPGSPGTLTMDTPPEHLTAMGGFAFTMSGSDAINVTLNGTRRLGGCTLSAGETSMPYPAISVDGSVAVTFRISDLVDGSLVIADDPNWTWTITQTR